MPVVEKIYKLSNIKQSGDTTQDTLKGEIRAFAGKADIENTFEAVYQFIEWYDKNKKL